jgi:hypothetical protein
MKVESKRALVFVSFIVGIIFVAILASECSKALASPPNYWMCVSKAEVFGAKRACDATGVDKNKKTAVEKATKKCQKDCFSKCSLQVCIPVGRKQ